VASASRFPKLSKNKIVRIALGLALVFGFLVDAAEWKEIRPLMQLEQWAYDARVRLFLAATPDPRIVIVDIDEKSLNAEGHWPWGRDKLALMLRQLFDKYGVRVVGFDVAFPEDDASSGLPVLESIAQSELKDNPQYQAFLQRARASLDYDRIFADEIAKRPVVLGVLLGAKEQRSGVLPPPAFTTAALAKAEFRHFTAAGYSGNTALLQASAIAAGHLYPALDPDGITRSVPMFMRIGDGFYEAMSLAVLRIYLGNAPVSFETTVVASGDTPQGWIRSFAWVTRYAFRSTTV
jgi:adenylate cyclase